jgi:hypothetical protein
MGAITEFAGQEPRLRKQPQGVGHPSGPGKRNHPKVEPAQKPHKLQLLLQAEEAIEAVESWGSHVRRSLAQVLAASSC